MMYRLFWKIFLSFWISLILFSLSTIFITSAYLERLRAQENFSNTRGQLVNYIKTGQSLADKQGIQGLKDWLQELDKRHAIPLLLVDQAGYELLGRPVPERIKHRIKRLSTRTQSSLHKRAPRRQPIQLPDGQSYRLVPDFQSVTLGRLLSRPRVIAIPLMLAAIVSGIVCLLLARYLSAPIGRLRSATKQLADGNLDQRVSPSMGRRKDEIADLARDFDHMAERLQRLLASQKQLLNDASHELRSPLARLHMALGLARQRSANNIEPELNRIERETERLNELINSLLSLAKLESGSKQIDKQTTDLQILLEAVVNDAAFEAAACQRKVQIHKSIPAIIMANRALLHSAIENVLRNAIRYTKQGSTVELSMTIEANQPEWAVITIRDHGPGVPKTMLEHLFEPFVRVEQARDRNSGNYGLGLAITKRAVHFHGGTISAHNEIEGGLSVIIRLPVLPDAC